MPPKSDANRSDANLSDGQSQAIAAVVREELARRRTSRQRLADEARISISTLEKALSGRRPFTLSTTIRLEQALGIALRKPDPGPAAPAAELAPEELGSYARRATSWLEGAYVTLRPSFSEARAIYAYRTDIRWDEKSSHLVFRESERTDPEFTQFGSVSVPHQSGHIYLVTNRHGQFRLIIVARPTIAGEMYGILTTLQAGPGSQLIPVATPIALIPASAIPDPQFGLVATGDRHHGAYRRHLDRALNEPFVRLLPG